MFKNYLKIALRNIMIHKGYSFINLAGLAIGMTCFIFIFLWIQDELNYDKFHKNANELYKVNMEEHLANGINRYNQTSYLLGPALKENFPGLIHFARTYASKRMIIKYGNNVFNENRFCFTNPSFFKMFAFSFVKGNPETALSDPSSIVLTENMAKKYFGSEQPMGKRLTVDNRREFIVTGVIKKIPHNSHFQYDFFVQDAFVKELGGAHLTWRTQDFDTFVLIGKNILPGELEQKITAWAKKQENGSKLVLKLQPISHIHLYPLNEPAKVIELIYIFSIIAFVILIIACINFMNLTTARFGNRAKEIGLRKVFGAERAALIRQFLCEAVILSFIALIFGVILVKFLLPVFNVLSGKQLALDLSIIRVLIGVGVFVGLLSGSYPALFLSSFKPASILRTTLVQSSKSGLLRKILVIVQFTFSIILFISTSTIYSQLNYIRDRDLGWDKDNLVYIQMPEAVQERYELIKNEILKNPDILSVTVTISLPSSLETGAGFLDWEGRKPDAKVEFNYAVVDDDYIETFGMKILQGRNFSREFSTDATNYILNEEAVKQMEMESPLGKRFNMWGEEGKIIGIVKDFNFRPLREKITPLVLIAPHWGYNYMVVRIRPGDPANIISYLRRTWDEFNPGYPFEYNFFAEDFDRLYRTERRLGEITGYFSWLAIFISCLGLFGLSSYTIAQRTKEIGVRKVLGASVSKIVQMLLEKFVVLVAIASVAAWPISYLIMNAWLQNFAFRKSINPGLFIGSSILALLIAIFTVSYQAVKASLANPVDALKYE